MQGHNAGVEDREAAVMTRNEIQRTNKSSDADEKLARRLVLDELFDLLLYQSLRDVATGELRAILEQLIPIETRHLEFWQDFFDLRVDRLNPARRLWRRRSSSA